MNTAYFETQFISTLDPEEIPEHAFIITGYNPMDEKLPVKENQKRNIILEDIIKQAGAHCLPIIGASQDLIHQEPSFVTDLQKAQVIELAKRFNQRAIFEIRIWIRFLTEGPRSPILQNSTEWTFARFRLHDDELPVKLG